MSSGERRSSGFLHRLRRALVLMAASTVALADAPFPDRLTGDWGGLRTTLAARGITADLESTHYYQGLMSGTGDKSFEYGGRLDLQVNFETGKLGLWDGGMIRTHTEYRYGDLPAMLGGTLLATNTGMILPVDADNEVVLTSLHLAQRIGDRANFLVGRINAADLLAEDPFFGGLGSSRFLNLAFAAPPSGITPPVITGAVLSLSGQPVAWTFMLYDADDWTDDYWPDHFFDSGVTFSVSANYSGEFVGRRSSVTVSGTYTTRDGANLGELLLPPELQTGDRDHSWHVGVQFTHLLREDPEQPETGWTAAFLKINGSDGNPNPYQGSIMAGIGGKGLFEARPQDTFGLGLFYVDFSDELQSSLDRFVTFEDERGVEAFYNYVVAEWLLVTADLQYVNPALGDTDNAFVGGLRAKILF